MVRRLAPDRKHPHSNGVARALASPPMRFRWGTWGALAVAAAVAVSATACGGGDDALDELLAPPA